MSLTRTFNSLSARAYGFGLGDSSSVIPPGTLLTSLSATTLTGICSAFNPSNNLYVLPYSDSSTIIPRIALSYDATNWYSNPLPTTGSTDSRISVYGILYANNLFTIWYNQQSPALRNMYYSSDGITWNKGSGDKLVNSLNKPSTDGTYHIYPGTSGTSNTQVIYTTDGITINQKNLTIVGGIANGASVYFNYANGLYFISYKNNSSPFYGQIYSSSSINGTYAQITNPTILNRANSFISKIIYLSGTYYLFGSSGTFNDTIILSTTDFNTFSTLYDGTVSTNYGGIFDVIYQNGQFIMSCGRSTATPVGKIVTTPDGFTLTERFTKNNIQIGTIHYFGNKYIANFENDLVTSPDAVTWTTIL